MNSSRSGDVCFVVRSAGRAASLAVLLTVTIVHQWTTSSSSRVLASSTDYDCADGARSPIEWRTADCKHSQFGSITPGNRDTSVGVAAVYKLDGWGIRVQFPSTAKRVFSSPQHQDLLRGPPNLLSDGHEGALSLGLNRLGYEADHSLPSWATVKNTRNIHPHMMAVN